MDHGGVAVRVGVWHRGAGEIGNQLADFLLRQIGLQRNGMAAGGLCDMDGALDVRRAGLPQIVDDVAQCLGDVLIRIGGGNGRDDESRAAEMFNRESKRLEMLEL